MITVILTIHVLIVLALIVVVLLQRSDGGALGLGGGGGGMMSGRGAASALTRTTSVLAALFFSTSIGLAIFSDQGESAQEAIEDLTGQEARDPNAPTTTDDLLRTLGGNDEPEATNEDLNPANLGDVLQRGRDGAADSADDLSDAIEGAAATTAAGASEAVDAAANAIDEAAEAAPIINEDTNDDEPNGE